MHVHRSSQRRAFTLIELLVVIGIIVVLSALAAAFMPRVSDSTNLSSSVDQLSQWLLTAKMRAKRDGVATGLSLIADPNNPGMFTTCQYIQQPDPLVGGVCLGQPSSPPAGAYPFNGNFYLGGLCTNAVTGGAQFAGVDFTGGQSTAALNLVLPGDVLELRDGGGVQVITGVPNGTTLTLSGSQVIPAPFTATTNYRILRQPRPILGENPLLMPGTMAVDSSLSSAASFDVLFAPSGAVVGPNAGLGKVFLYVHDLTQNPVDPGRAAVVAVQTLTGYIGAYNSGPAGNYFQYANEGRSSGL